MFLSAWEVQCIKLCDCLYRYVPWKFPVAWNSDFSDLKISNRKIHSVPFLLSVLFLALIGLMSSFVVCTQSRYFPELPYANSVILVIVAVGSINALDLFRLIIGSMNLLLPGFAKMLQIYNIYQPHLKINPQKKHPADYILLLSLGLVFPFAPLLLAGGCCISGMDAFYIILDKFFFPSRYERSNAFIAAQSLGIFMFYYLPSIDITRFFCALSVCGLAFTKRLDIFTRKLAENWKFCQRTPLAYNTLYVLVARVMRQPLESITYRILCTTFWLTVGCSWAVITQDANALSYPIYFFLASFSVLLFVVACAVMHQTSSIGESTLRHLAVQRFVAKYSLSKKPSKQARINCMILLALQPMRTHYGPFEVIDQEFMGRYCWDLIERTFDAILMQAT